MCSVQAELSQKGLHPQREPQPLRCPPRGRGSDGRGRAGPHAALSPGGQACCSLHPRLAQQPQALNQSGDGEAREARGCRAGLPRDACVTLAVAVVAALHCKSLVCVPGLGSCVLGFSPPRGCSFQMNSISNTRGSTGAGPAPLGDTEPAQTATQPGWQGRGREPPADTGAHEGGGAAKCNSQTPWKLPPQPVAGLPLRGSQLEGAPAAAARALTGLPSPPGPPRALVPAAPHSGPGRPAGFTRCREQPAEPQHVSELAEAKTK